MLIWSATYRIFHLLWLVAVGFKLLPLMRSSLDPSTFAALLTAEEMGFE